MKIDNVLLAEGVAADSRGALTLVGFNQRSLNVPALPISLRQVLVLTLVGEVGEEPTPGTPTGTLNVSVMAPNGKTTFALTQVIPAATLPPQKGVPPLGNLALDLLITGDAYGKYTVQVRWLPPNEEEQTREVSLYVTEPPRNDA